MEGLKGGRLQRSRRRGRFRASMKRPNILLVVGGLMTVAACNDDDPTAPGETGLDPGTFEATISGDLSASLEGTAAYQASTSTVNGLYLHAIQLVPENQFPGEPSWFMFAGSEPELEEGTYPVVRVTEEDWEEAEAGWVPEALTEGVGYLGFFSEEGVWASIVLSSDGEITFRWTDAGGLEGEFAIQGDGRRVEFTGEAEEDISVDLAGAFHAVPGSITLP